MNQEIKTKDKEVFLPPYVVNNFNPLLPLSQTIDWGINKLGIQSIHSMGITGKGIKVAVIDTYIDPTHPDIIGAVVKQLNATSEPYTTAQNGHGQGTSGVIGARNNNVGVLGVAPGCDIIAIKAMRESGSGDIGELVKAIDMAIAEKVQIINMSLGTTADVPEMKAACARAIAAGILVVCSAGNDGQADSVNYPGKYDGTLAIAATNEAGNVSSFSSMGWDVDLAAPGERILTCWKNKTYAVVSGTSFSAPYVSGCLALLLELKLLITADRLDTTAIDIETPGKDVKSGYGLISPTGFIAKYNVPAPPTDPMAKAKQADSKLVEAHNLLIDFIAGK